MYLLAPRNGVPRSLPSVSDKFEAMICFSSSAEEFWDCIQGARSASTQQRHRIHEYTKYISRILWREETAFTFFFAYAAGCSAARDRPDVLS